MTIRMKPNTNTKTRRTKMNTITARSISITIPIINTKATMQSTHLKIENRVLSQFVRLFMIEFLNG